MVISLYQYSVCLLLCVWESRDIYVHVEQISIALWVWSCRRSWQITQVKNTSCTLNMCILLFLVLSHTHTHTQLMHFNTRLSENVSVVDFSERHDARQVFTLLYDFGYVSFQNKLCILSSFSHSLYHNGQSTQLFTNTMARTGFGRGGPLSLLPS